LVFVPEKLLLLNASMEAENAQLPSSAVYVPLRPDGGVSPDGASLIWDVLLLDELDEFAETTRVGVDVAANIGADSVADVEGKTQGEVSRTPTNSGLVGVINEESTSLDC
jgi:hypothetical protein